MDGDYRQLEMMMASVGWHPQHQPTEDCGVITLPAAVSSFPYSLQSGGFLRFIC